MLPSLTTCSADDLVDNFNSKIDVVAPVKVKIFSVKHKAPWINAESVAVDKRESRKAERN